MTQNDLFAKKKEDRTRTGTGTAKRTGKDRHVVKAQMHSETSIAAAEEMAPIANLKRLAVLFAFKRAMGKAWCRGEKYGLSDMDCQDRLGMNPSTQRPRRIELVEEGLLEAVGTKLSPSNRKCTVWALTQKGFDMAEMLPEPDFKAIKPPKPARVSPLQLSELEAQLLDVCAIDGDSVTIKRFRGLWVASALNGGIVATGSQLSEALALVQERLAAFREKKAAAAKKGRAAL